MNKAIIIGKIGSIDLKTFDSGKHCLKVSIATNEKYKDKEITEWHKVSVWGKNGETLFEFLEKGQTVLVEGKIQSSVYEKDGNKFRNTEILTDWIKVLSKKENKEDPF